MTEEKGTDNVVRLVVHNRRTKAPTAYEYKRCEDAWPVVPAEPRWTLWTYFADVDAFGSSRIVAWRITPERALPVTIHCQVKGAQTATVRPDGKALGAKWFADVAEWEKDVRQRVAEAKAQGAQ